MAQASTICFNPDRHSTVRTKMSMLTGSPPMRKTNDGDYIEAQPFIRFSMGK
jgi:hypothetical protein